MSSLGKVKSIVQVTDIALDNKCCRQDGYKVVTDKCSFLVLIDNFQSCCEDWGYFSSDDDIKKFVGKELKKICFTDEALNTKVYNENIGWGLDKGGVVFVDFIFLDGAKLQFAVYNGHNGYYGHEVVVTKTETLLEKVV